jgi:hypothetical protein
MKPPADIFLNRGTAGILPAGLGCIQKKQNNKDKSKNIFKKNEPFHDVAALTLWRVDYESEK